MTTTFVKRPNLSKTFLPYLTILLLTVSTAFAQNTKTVKGSVQDSTGLSVIAATIKLVSPMETLYSTSDSEGHFTFEKIKADEFTLEINSLGYRTIKKNFQFKTNNILDIGNLTMTEDSRVLQEVKVEGSPLIVVKEDTLEYRAKDYNLKENAVTEDLLKKLDGVEVDKDGNIKAQGEAITRVRINGKDFFGGDVKTATKTSLLK